MIRFITNTATRNKLIGVHCHRFFSNTTQLYQHHSHNMGLDAILSDERLKHYVSPQRVPVSKLDVKEAFDLLSKEEKLYAHYFSQACWAGAPIVLAQVSNESLDIFQLFNALFANNGVQSLKEKRAVDDQAFENLLIYATLFLGNMGNYLSFGDSKFIPRLEKEDFEKIVLSSKNQTALDLWNKVKDAIYDLSNNRLELDFGNSAYYSNDVSKEEAELVQEYMNENNISAYNTRLFKTGDKQFELRLASAQKLDNKNVEYKDLQIQITYGDYGKYVARIRDNLQKALQYAANEHQADMIKKYIDHFNSGDVEQHKESQRFWIKDKGPSVETNIGFIESYRDPLRVRGEYEGFVAVVNKDMSKKYGVLVENAEQLLKQLPWNKAAPDTQPFEIEKFSKPDFTSLEVLTFTSSGLPAGINIPNYPDVREVDGFKNVSLGNVLNAVAPSEEITFLKDSEKEMYKRLKGAAFALQVAAHELIGHGSGRQITADQSGKLPLDISKVTNPVTGQPVTTYYKFGETFNAKFGEMSNSYEECRAEAVGIYLTTFEEFLQIFGYDSSAQETDDVVYINWLHMARAGLLGLEFYNPISSKWLQAHMRARYVILQVLLEAGEGLVTIEETNDDIFISLDRSKIRTVGVKAISNLLMKLGVYKSICDVSAATEMYNHYSAVDDRFLKLRKIVLDKKQPRKVFIQPLTVLDGEDDVKLKEFEPSYEGMLTGFTELVQL
jgi:dipeptidyl-peptidase-3